MVKTTIEATSWSMFIKNPVVLTATSGGIPEGATFHRLRLVVTVQNITNQFDFSKPPVGAQLKATFNLSTALVAAMKEIKYTAKGYNPNGDGLGAYYWTFTANAYDEYMLDGVFYEKMNESNTFTSGKFYNGRLTDREQMLYNVDGEEEVPEFWSRKPTDTPEIVFRNTQLLVSKNRFNGNPVVSVVDITAGTNLGLHSLAIAANDPRKYYVIDKPADGYEMRFLNSLGLHESVCVNCLIQGETNVTTKRHIIPRQETINDFSHGIVYKQNDHERWKMSSGPLDRQWQRWYMHELLMARWAWIKVDDQWMQVHILPEETVKGIDRIKADLLTVEFTIEFDINGSPFR